MKNRFYILIIFITGASTTAFNQDIRVVNSHSSAVIQNAVFQVVELKTGREFFEITDSKGTVSSQINLPAILKITHVGYREYQDSIFEIPQIIRLMPSQVELDEVVITGQYQSQSAKNSLFNVRSINEAQISKMAARDIRQVLSYEPMVNLTNDAALGSSNLNIQGMGGQNVKILVDGVPLVGFAGSGIDLSQISTGNIDKIEIISGPMAVNYGSNALAGVINIITKQPENKLSIQSELQEETAGNEYGLSRGIHYQSLGASFNLFKSLAIRQDISRNYFGGFYGDRDSRTPEWLPKTSYFSNTSLRTKQGNWTFQYRFNALSEIIESPGEPESIFNPIAIDDRYSTQRFVNTVEINRLISGGRINAIFARTNYQRIKSQSIYDLSSGQKYLNTIEGAQDSSYFKTWSARATISKAVTEKISGEWGYDINLDETSGGRIASGEKSIQDFAFYNSYEWSQGNLQIRPGFRVAYNSRFKSPLITSLNLKYEISENMQFRASYGQGFRAPSLRELYFEFIDSSHRVLGNENLSPESSNHYDISIQRKPNGPTGLTTEVTLFYNHVENMISFGLDERDPTTTTYININEFKSIGGSLTGRFTRKNISGSIGVSLISLESSISGINFDDTPQISTEVVGSVTWTPVSKSFSISSFNKLKGKEYSYYLEADQNQNTVQQQVMDGYLWTDIIVHKSLNKRLGIDAGVKNLMNVKRIASTGPSGGIHTGGTSVPIGYGRSFFIKLLFKYQ